MITTAAESAPHPRFGGTLQCAIFQPITTLDAANYLNFAERQVASNLYEGLVKRDRFGRINAAVAQSWMHSDDHRIWTFVIARRMKFHNGQPVTATDVKLAWEQSVRDGGWMVSPQPLFLIEGTEAYRNNTATQIQGIRVLDDSHLQVTLQASDPEFLGKLTSPTAWVVIPGDSQPIGTGRFRPDSFSTTEVRLTANRDYAWGRPYLDRLTFRYYANLDEALFDFESGVLDALPLPITEVERRQREGLDDILIKTDPAALVYLRLLPQTPSAQDGTTTVTPHNVIKYAVDTRALLHLQYGENPFTPFPLPYGLVKARRRLKHAGWNGRLNLLYAPLPDNTGNAIATWLKRDYLSQIGLQVEVGAADSDAFQGGFKGDATVLALLSMPIAQESEIPSLEIGQPTSLIPLYLLPVSFLCQPRVRGVKSVLGGVLAFEETWLVK